MDKYIQILIKYWGYTSFRPMQEDVIHGVMEGNDTLALMPTGGGKSLTFQVPALAKEGICLVITPLIALMRDQVENLKRKNISALSIHSGMSFNEIDIALDNCIYGDVKFLYVSPERLSTEIFRTRITKMNINLVAIDEAHCISQWGYDFRPSYLKIAELREFIPEVPFLALTATATPDVVKDIQQKLGFKKENLLQKSFERKNLVYLVRNQEDKTGYILNTLKKIKNSGIIYVRTRKKTQELAQLLQKEHISADYYHAGLSHQVRTQKQGEWKEGKTKIMVSTNAFGMGIDKPDVRYVIHFEAPDNLEAYYQEAGRAGRDEKKAWAVLLYNESDRQKALQRAKKNFPDIKEIKRIYNGLGNYLRVPYGGGKHLAFDFNAYEFARAYSVSLITIYSSIKVLQQEGYLELTDELNHQSKLHFLVNRDDLYKFQVANATFDGFIKLLLRIYSGVFSDYSNIDEAFLAKKANVKIDVIYNYLNKLKSLGIINYIPKRDKPMIVYTEERLPNKSLVISTDNYKFRKDRYYEKLEAVLDYAENDGKCRSQQLLAYFGEKDAKRCGQCDVCIKRNELELSKYEFDLILDDIKKILSEKEINMKDLVGKVQYPEEKTIKVVRWLLDNNKIIQENYILRWNK